VVRDISRISCALMLFLVGVLLPVQQVKAQEAPTGNLYNLKTAAFPTIKLSVDAYDASGNFITGLDKTDFTILEDGQKHSPDEVVVFDPGVEFVVVINPARSFTILDNQGISRYDKIAKALSSWAGTLPAISNDAYSLVTAGGPSAFHTRDPKSWVTSLNAYQPKAKDLSSSFDILTQAIDIASGSMLEPGARRAILFITPLAETADVSTLQSLALRATQLNVHVFVWVVASADSPATPGFLGLQDLATQTGGQFFLYSGSETLPDPSGYLDPMRSGYQLTYTSSLTSSGSHSLVVSISSQAGQIDLPAVDFEMDIQPPNPILITPPVEILRSPADASHYDVSALTPAQQKLELIIEFPDGHPRALVSTSLLVDGETIAKNTTEPFNQFVWDLTGYTTSGKHDLQVEVVDVLGLQKLSISIPIMMTIVEAPPAWKVLLANYGFWISIGVLVLASMLLTWLILRIARKRHAAKKSQGTTSRVAVLPAEEQQSIFHRSVKKAPAFLLPLTEDGSNPVTGNLQLGAKEIRLGSDASKVDFYLKDPSIEVLHAIIYRQETSYSVSDQGSLAGTWINYNRLSAGQQILNHGDIIHFGILAYRFLLNDPLDMVRSRINSKKADPYL
jgi:hypothetical protein